jgi:rhomboid protease GluP
MRTVILYACAAAVMIAGLQVLMDLDAGGRPGPPWELARRAWRRPVPPVALGLVVVFTAMAVVQLAYHPVIGALERAPGGGWWRVGTALLVQSSGGFQLAFNLAALIVVAPVANRVLGNAWTLVVFIVSGLVAQTVSAAGWSPRGGGDSVAICGLVGALATAYVCRGTDRSLRLGAALVPVAGLVLCLVTNNHGIGVLTGCVFGVALAGRVIKSPGRETVHHTGREPR